jgi:tetratricopeptide (TPR) repeat protein
MHLGVSLPSTHVESLLEAAEEKCGQRQCEEAIGLLEEAVRIQPGNARLYYQLGFCHSGGCRHHRLVDPDMAEECLRHGLSLVGRSAEPLLRAKILDALGNTLVESRKGPQTGRLREAIAYHQEAAAIYGSSELPDEWAREEFNQANVWCDLLDSEFPEKWTEAAKHYENALRVRTKDRDPKRYATTVMNLGTALRQLPAGDRSANVLKAIRCYHAALRIYTLEASPSQFANACNNLGNACLTCPARGGAAKRRHVRYALRHFEQALEVWTRAEHPYYCALAQYNRGCAYFRLAASPENVEKALVCLTDAYECALSCGHTEIARLAKAQVDRMVLPRSPW